MGVGFHGRLQTRVKIQHDGKVVQFPVIVSTSGHLHPFDLTKEKSHEIKHVNWGFIQKATG